EYGAGRGCIPRRNRHRAAAEGAEFRAARGALAGEALSLNGPSSRRSCRARVCAQGLFADPGISRDRTSASAACRTLRNRRSEERETAKIAVKGCYRGQYRYKLSVAVVENSVMP